MLCLLRGPGECLKSDSICLGLKHYSVFVPLLRTSRLVCVVLSHNSAHNFAKANSKATHCSHRLSVCQQQDYERDLLQHQLLKRSYLSVRLPLAAALLGAFKSKPKRRKKWDDESLMLFYFLIQVMHSGLLYDR